jgi:hypothetical protein
MRLINNLLATTLLCTIEAEGQAEAPTQPAATAPDAPAANGAKPPEPKTVAEDMANRRVFSAEYRDPTDEEQAAYLAANPGADLADAPRVLVKSAVDAASEYLNASGTTFTDFGDYPLAAPGIDDDGNFDSDVYTDDMDVMVALLRNKSKVKCIVVAPVPTLDSILSDAGGTDWATKILHKEMNHVAVRALREADDVSTVVDQIPTTRLGYIESNRGDGGILESFAELYKPVNATLSAKFPVWAKARLIKSELRKAFESKGYAAEFYAALEDYKGQSLFVVGLGLAIATAKRKGLDPTIFERWLATRDQKVYTPGEQQEADEDEFNVDSLTEALLAESAPAAPDADAAKAGESAPTDPNAPADEAPAATGDEATQVTPADAPAADPAAPTA